MRSAFSCFVSGMRVYLSTLYPAWVSIASRFASSVSLPLWLESSSSITASTLKVLSATTKSARFCEKLYRLAPFFAINIAPKLTWVSTTYSGCGKHSISLQYIPCSFAVAIFRFANAPFAFRPFARVKAAMATNIAISSSGQSDFMLPLPSEASTLCDL